MRSIWPWTLSFFRLRRCTVRLRRECKDDRSDLTHSLPWVQLMHIAPISPTLLPARSRWQYGSIAESI